MTSTAASRALAAQRVETADTAPWFHTIGSDEQREQIAAALPMPGETMEKRLVVAARMQRSALTLIRTTPAIAECTRSSVMGGLLCIAQLGLEIGPLDHAYLVPFNRKVGPNEWTKEAQLIVGYKGIQELARRSGTISGIEARVVYERDEFDYELGTSQFLRHKPPMTDRGQEMIGSYCIARLVTGEPLITVLGQEEVLKHRALSKTWQRDGDKSPWVVHAAAFWAKTAVRVASAFLPLSPESMTLIQADESVQSWDFTQGDDVEPEVIDLGDHETPDPPESDEGSIDAEGHERDGGEGAEEEHRRVALQMKAEDLRVWATDGSPGLLDRASANRMSKGKLVEVYVNYHMQRPFA